MRTLLPAEEERSPAGKGDGQVTKRSKPPQRRSSGSRRDSITPAPLIEAPAWLGGGDAARLLRDAYLRVRPAGKSQFRIQAIESYEKSRQPLLVTVGEVQDSSGKNGAALSQLAKLPEPAIDGSLKPLLEKVLATLTDSDLLELVTHIQLELMAANPDDLPDAVLAAVNALRHVDIEGLGSEAFPNCSVHVIRRARALPLRAKVSQFLLRLEHEQSQGEELVNRLRSENEGGRQSFGSSDGHQTGVMMLDSYLAPLEGALSPMVWTIPVRRVNGTVLISLGRPVAGTTRLPSNLLGTIAFSGPGQSRPGRSMAAFSNPDASARAISWWVEHLDRVLSVATDPVTFSRDGNYQPIVALQALATVEQVFGLVAAIQRGEQSSHATRTAMFATLDTISSLRSTNLNALLTLSKAERALERLASSMGAAAAEVLLPNARAGVEALRSVQEEFFLTVADGQVSMATTGKRTSLENAAVEYLALLRNAQHGFSTSKSNDRDKIGTLLSIHTGRISADLSNLAWLYLLDLLNEPELLRKSLSTGRSWVSASG